MPTVAIAQNLYVWTITLENGEVRTNIGSSLASLIAGNFPSPVVSATRGAAFTSDPVPTLASLAPATAALGAADFVLHVTGTGFRAGCQIFWNGQPKVTTVVSPTEVTTPVSLAGLAVGSIPVTVRSITGLDSNALAFALTATE